MSDTNKMGRNAIRLAVEKALLKIDPEGIEKVQSMLTQHNHTTDDYFDNPQALRDTLCKLYGNRNDKISE